MLMLLLVKLPMKKSKLLNRHLMIIKQPRLLSFKLSTMLRVKKSNWIMRSSKTPRTEKMLPRLPKKLQEILNSTILRASRLMRKLNWKLLNKNLPSRRRQEIKLFSMMMTRHSKRVKPELRRLRSFSTNSE